MRKVRSSELKAKLGRYMQAARAGEEIVVTDRGRPVARLLPYAEPEAEPAIQRSQPRDPGAPPLGALAIRSLSPRGTDTTALLRAERDRR
jgi:prevent-host-death family protein